MRRLVTALRFGAWMVLGLNGVVRRVADLEARVEELYAGLPSTEYHYPPEGSRRPQ